MDVDTQCQLGTPGPAKGTNESAESTGSPADSTKTTRTQKPSQQKTKRTNPLPGPSPEPIVDEAENIKEVKTMLMLLRDEAQKTSKGSKPNGPLIQVLDKVLGLTKNMTKANTVLQNTQNAQALKRQKVVSDKDEPSQAEDIGDLFKVSPLAVLQDKLKRQEERLAKQDEKLDKLLAMFSAGTPLITSTETQTRPKKFVETATQTDDTSQTDTDSAMETDTETKETWSQVAKRKKKPKTAVRQDKQLAQSSPSKKSSNKPPAILVKVKEGKTYAETVNLIKNHSGVDANSIGAPLKSMRRTLEGHLIMEFTKGKETEVAAKKLGAALKLSLGDQIGVVNQLGTSVEMEIADIDAITSKEEVEKAIHSAAFPYGKAPEGSITITGLWSVRAGTQVATVKVPRSVATSLTRVNIGWVSCRVRPRINILRCFRCHGYGHATARCNGVDLSTACRRCGITGHQEKECDKGNDNCVACDRLGVPKAPHKPGSGQCAARKLALIAHKP